MKHSPSHYTLLSVLDPMLQGCDQASSICWQRNETQFVKAFLGAMKQEGVSGAWS